MFINRAITITSLAGGVIAIILSFLYVNPIFPLISAVFFAFSLAVWKYGYLLIPILTRGTRTVEIRGGYEVPSTRDAIIKKTENGYLGTKFLEISYYESSMDKSNEERKSMFEAFEKAISSLKYIVKISLMISTLDLSRHIDEIKTKRSAAETKKTKNVKMSNEDVMRTERELAYWNRLLDRITQGERPVEVIAYASTTAFGLTREEAMGRVSRQSKEIKTILSSSLGCDVRELADLDMIRCFEWDFFFPTTHEEIKDQLF